jgi:hypothetical protein
MSNFTNNRCFHCGISGHFIKSCPDKNNDIICTRCGRNHLSSLCYAKKDINENIIYDYSSDSSDSHDIIQTTQEEKASIAEIDRQYTICSRCKKMGHYRSSCYETNDIYGDSIKSCTIS